ncbi:MAG TPA: CPBP family intramembrane glutamic endopeptidase [Candidatus Binataceae bacterium]|nr:CPBP family intramembrane glutamic endopeptidase [Candidatus Binataceae bacterium]
MSFTAKLSTALAAAIAAAVAIAPIAALAVAGWNFPFPRIFDRTLMIALFAAIAWNARALRLNDLLTAGFNRPVGNLHLALRGFCLAVAAIAILSAGAILAGGGLSGLGAVAARIPKYAVAALFIGVLEEGFFRAFLLGGMSDDFGRRRALYFSAAIYALAHLVRSPAHFVVSGYEPGAGLWTLLGSLDQLSHPAVAVPELAGLFLLGIVLGEAYLQTGTVYLSIGLHGGFVLGAKLWPKLIEGRSALPGWLLGVGPVPLIGGVGAWAIAAAILVMLPRLIGESDRQT